VPAGHAHFEPWQTCVDAHAVPHAAQLSGSAVRSTQLLPHAVNGGLVQLAVQAPPWQKGVGPLHTLPHAPQLLGSLATAAQAPLHVTVPAAHAHLPATHDSPVAQAVPHAPQLAPSFVVSTHAALQSVSPMAHADWHVPFEQARFASHTWPHEPQFFGSPASDRHWVPHADWPVGHTTGGGGMQ